MAEIRNSDIQAWQGVISSGREIDQDGPWQYLLFVRNQRVSLSANTSIQTGLLLNQSILLEALWVTYKRKSKECQYLPDVLYLNRLTAGSLLRKLF
jgi:hypothetical protein